MADEEVMGSASPAPSDHKRKLDDLDSEPFEQPPVSAGSNGNSESVADGDSDAAPTGVSPEDPDVKRPRLDDKPDSTGLVEASENGHQEEREDEPKEDVTELSSDEKTIESEKDQEKTDEPLDAVNKESVTDETRIDAIDVQSAEIPEESAKEEHQEPEGEQQELDPIPDVAFQEDEHSLKDQSAFSDQPTSRRMEVPSNKVGVLIGKGGDTIRTLQYSSGARIQITRDADADPNSATRPVELIGSLESINKAERLIKDVITEADAGGSPSLVARGFNANPSGAGEQIQIQVPNEKVGMIIGKGGENIKDLQARSGARIQLIPQHLPEGDQSKERTVRVTGDRRQIEAAKEMIKEVMDQPVSARSSTPSRGNNNQQKYRSRGPDSHWGGSRGGSGHHHHHHSQPTGYNNYPPQRSAPYHSQNPPYSNYPPQQPPSKNNYGWDQRPPHGPPEHSGYDYYGGGQGGHMAAPPPHQPPMHSHAPPPSYNYGPPQGPDYSQPPPYQQAPPPYGGHGYGEPKYDSQVPPPQQPSYPQSAPHYGQQDQYGKPLAYNAPPQGPYGQPYGQPRQQAYNYGSAPVQQGYPQYGTAPPPVNDGYAAGGGYGPQGGQAVSGYGQTSGQQVAPGSGYGQPAPAPVPAPAPAPPGGYGQYPSTQGGYAEQAAPNSAGYGYGAPPAAEPGYAGGPGAGYGAPPAVQPAYSQPAPVPAPVPVPVPAQQGYDQSAPQVGGYVTPQAQQTQAGYGQYDSSQMYGGHR